ncbi:MAG: helicase-exonuclease AddAB subunit AddA [Clostridia bacterium]|nr:helicase-exonuclease AddAB subunit AddA [Clostridia bacterium]
MSIKLTHSQQMAVEKQGNILVAAAAGSGKTAVLVERVIKKLCSKINPVSADKLLIVTFTNAAAAEMRSRIEKRLDEECRNNPEDLGLLLQKHLLTSAKICTIDSFCIDFVRENFEKLGISPDFTISENNALKPINERVLGEILNEYFESGDETFKELLDIVGAEFDERNFSDLVLNLYEYSRQLPFPEKWFETLYSYYGDNFAKTNPWHVFALKRTQNLVKEYRVSLSKAVDLLSADLKMADKFMPAFLIASEQLEKLDAVSSTDDWDGVYNALNSFNLGSLPSVKGSNDISEIKAAKDIYDQIKKLPESLKKFFYADSQFIQKQFEKLYTPMKLLVEILNEFSNRVFEAYVEENTFTFHNTEALALKLLCTEKDGKVEVSEQGKEFLELFDEVCVDEYQDTNDLQNMLFYVLSNKDSKLFAVGDVKQSIYGFRGANPEYFLNKKNAFTDAEIAKDDEPKKIILGNNFRSRPEVCEFINYFFSQFMTVDTGKINYDKEEMLIPSGKFPESSYPAVSVNIIDALPKTDKKRAEAKQIARFIKETMARGDVIRKDEETLRPAKYSDFTILLRSMKGNASVLAEELKNQGIPVNFSTEGFCEYTEISVMLSLLRVIDNPSRDVDLLTVMMSPIFGFTAEDMANLRIGCKDGSLYSCVITASQNGDIKCSNFLKKIENFRLYAVTNTLSSLLEILIEETGFFDIVSAFSDGARRKNNLLLLIEYAVSYEKFYKGSISAFAEYMYKQDEKGIKSAVSLSGEDTVKIMSIHASKGLQFPVCIIAGMASAFNSSEVRQSAVYTTKSGIGFKYYDEFDKVQYTTVSREAILEQLRLERLEEELRLLYVAMTRTQDILHFTAVSSNTEKKIESVKGQLIGTEGKVTASLVANTKTYFEWLLVSLLLHPDAKNLRGAGSSIICQDTESRVKVELTLDEEIIETVAENKNIEYNEDREFSQNLANNISYKYPFEDLFSVQSKASVSVLANKAESEKYNFTQRPQFMNKDKMSAANRGTAMHKVMQFFDFAKWETPESELERLVEWEFISEEEAEIINLNALKEFFASDVFKRILKAQSVHREMRFLTELPALIADKTLDPKFENEKIIVQGAVDICFVEDGEVVILDFKTDRTDDLEQLSSAYGEQLNLYSRACEKIFKKAVKEKIIYSFHHSDYIKL